MIFWQSLAIFHDGKTARGNLALSFVANAGIKIRNWEEIDRKDLEYLDQIFEKQIFPVLTPLAVDPSHPFPYISNLSLNLAVVLQSEGVHQINFARVKVPPILPRFVKLPDNRGLVPLEQVIAAHLNTLFAGHTIVDHFTFRITRSADLTIEEEKENDLLAAMESVLRFRQHGAHAVRLEVTTRMSAEVLDLLAKEHRIGVDLVYHRENMLGLNGLWELYGLDRPDLKDRPWSPRTQPALNSQSEIDIFSLISERDVLVHHPYESFATSTGAFLAQAALDPDVLAIKQTLYRTSEPDDPASGGEAAVVQSLIAAAEAGKQVVVLIELKARFDEAANITWAKMLENAGAHVVYGVSGLKTHAKLLLVVRKENGELRRYAHIGTGNYNPKTARLYEDLGLFTADPEIGADLSELFNVLTGYNKPKKYRKLVVAPDFMRHQVVKRIRQEATKGSTGSIMFKLNHLADPEIIDELYAASVAGCRVDLIVRGICGLRAGVTGISENIEVRSIVGRYLEHSRIYRFGDPSVEAVYYIGSADMMPRNLNGRVEVLLPVTNSALKSRLEDILDTLIGDNALTWKMDPGQETWSKIAPRGKINAQLELQSLTTLRTKPLLHRWE